MNDWKERSEKIKKSRKETMEDRTRKERKILKQKRKRNEESKWYKEKKGEKRKKTGKKGWKIYKGKKKKSKKIQVKIASVVERKRWIKENERMKERIEQVQKKRGNT